MAFATARAKPGSLGKHGVGGRIGLLTRCGGAHRRRTIEQKQQTGAGSVLAPYGMPQAEVADLVQALRQGDQPSLWHDKVLLDEDFYRALCDHPVPVSEAALRAIGPRSLVIDIYIWLVYRLHAVKGEMAISWPALHAQFGAGVALLKNFKPQFVDSLRMALAAYPDARVTIDENGVVLYQSRPAIARL